MLARSQRDSCCQQYEVISLEAVVQHEIKVLDGAKGETLACEYFASCKQLFEHVGKR
jgi:hypothetical protein